MPAGGARPGAGRPKGARDKGQRVGGRGERRQTASLKGQATAAVAAVINNGETPLETLLRIMRTSTDQAEVIDCAKAAAPYLHPRLTSVAVSGDRDNPLQHEHFATIELVAVEASVEDVDEGADTAAGEAGPGIHGAS
jgi:hypothetical protein